MIHEWIRHSVESKVRSGVAVLVDGENISHDLSDIIVSEARKLGPLVIMRVYGNAAKIPKWGDAAGFRLAHAGTGKNATDLLLAVEAVSMFHEGSIETVVIASSDRDFAHLAHHLRERQLRVVGIGEAKAPAAFRKACSRFIELAPRTTARGASAGNSVASSPKSSTIDKKITGIVKTEGHDNGLLISKLGELMRSKHGFQISSVPERTWRKYLTDRPSLYRCDPRGTNAKVHLIKP